MECFKCGVKLADDSKFCPRCGTIFSKEDVEKIGGRRENKFLDAYFPERKINLNFYDISIGYLFFHFMYAFYKKMYIEGIISLIGFLIFCFMFFSGMNLVFGSMGFYFLPVLFLLMLSIFIYIYYVLKFNYLYIEHVKCRINRFINENPNSNDDEIFILCKKDSKGNLWLPIIIVISLLIYIINPF